MKKKKGQIGGVVVGLTLMACFITIIWLLIENTQLIQERVQKAEDYCKDKGLLYFKLNCDDNIVTCYELGDDDLMNLKPFKTDICE